MKTYIVTAFNQFNNELIRIERDSQNKAIKTGEYWCKRGAEYCTIEDEKFHQYY